MPFRLSAATASDCFMRSARLQQVDGAAAIVVAPQQLLLFQVGDVLVHGRQRAEAEPFGNLFEGRRITVLVHKRGDEVVYLFLAAGESHGCALGPPCSLSANKRRNVNESLAMPANHYGSVHLGFVPSRLYPATSRRVILFGRENFLRSCRFRRLRPSYRCLTNLGNSTLETDNALHAADLFHRTGRVLRSPAEAPRHYG